MSVNTFVQIIDILQLIDYTTLLHFPELTCQAAHTRVDMRGRKLWPRPQNCHEKRSMHA